MRLRRGVLALFTIGGAAVGIRAAAKRNRRVELSGKRAFVTGGSRGLGFALARELAREGCRVAICARDAAELDQAREELQAEELTLETVTCDVSSVSEVERAIGQVRERFGGIDILVNNAGVIEVGPVESMTLDDFHEAMDVMYWGLVHATLAVLPEMRERRSGSIVNITSIGGKVPAPHLLPYVAAKFAAVGFSEGVHAELARYGVRVTTVVPGLMRTGSFFNAWFKGDERKEFAWFSVASSLPPITIEGEKAARRIVEAIRHGEAEVTLTVPAKLAARVHGLAPATSTRLAALANRLLPKSTSRAEKVRGEVADERLDSAAHRRLTAPGRAAARKYQ